MDELTDQGPRARLDVVPGADGDRLLVRLGGELDLAGMVDVQPAIDRLLGMPPQPARIDVADLEFLDSTGVAMLIRLAKHFERVEVVHARPAVRRVVQVLGLETVLGLDGA
jgi:anti-sigma B factor antagonist